MTQLQLLQRDWKPRGDAKELPGNQVCQNKPIPVAFSAKNKGDQEAGFSFLPPKGEQLPRSMCPSPCEAGDL